jgi:hypothetical protein
MNEDRLQFSLSGLFVGTTFIAVVVAIAVNFPPIGIFALLATFPFLFAAGLVFISNRVPALANAFLVVIVGATIFAVAFLVQNGLVGLTLDCWR